MEYTNAVYLTKNLILVRQKNDFDNTDIFMSVYAFKKDLEDSSSDNDNGSGVYPFTSVLIKLFFIKKTHYFVNKQTHYFVTSKVSSIKNRIYSAKTCRVKGVIKESDFSRVFKVRCN